MTTLQTSPEESEIRWIRLEQLWSPNFQRPVSDDWVSKTVEDCDRQAIGVLSVADSSTWDPGDPHAGAAAGEEHMYAVLDGQGRVEVLRQLEYQEARCEIHHVTRKRAAEITARINRGRRDVKPYYRLRMSWAAEDAPSLDMRARVEACGFQLAPDTDHYDQIGAITAIEDIYFGRRGVLLYQRQDVLTPTLETIRLAVYGKQKSLDADMLRGVAIIFALNGDEDVDRDRLSDTIAARKPASWLEGSTFGRTDQRSRSMAIAKTIAEEYKRGKLAGGKYKPLQTDLSVERRLRAA